MVMCTNEDSSTRSVLYVQSMRPLLSQSIRVGRRSACKVRFLLCEVFLPGIKCSYAVPFISVDGVSSKSTIGKHFNFRKIASVLLVQQTTKKRGIGIVCN